ncbi:hypothetical protein ACWDWU_16175 [Streptomyces sp. NPDC003442]
MIFTKGKREQQAAWHVIQALTSAVGQTDKQRYRRDLVAIIHLAARYVATSRISHALSLRPMSGPLRTGVDPKEREAE